MKIRKAEEKDIPRLLALLGQVLQIHAEIRPDIFIPGTTKYTVCELAALLPAALHIQTDFPRCAVRAPACQRTGHQ